MHLYSVIEWGDEVWLYRGEYRFHRVGFVRGRVDLGEGFRRRLWTEPLSG